LDTNVLVAALRSRRGWAFRLLQQVRRRRVEVAVSVAWLLEYEDVLTRPGLLPHIPRPLVQRFLDAFCRLAHHQPIHYTWRPYLKDPKDDMVLEVAVAAGASHIVTFNKKDFTEAGDFGIQILTPKEFMQEMGG
jgi:putative PIN family toxin of toxin-antitoxin system